MASNGTSTASNAASAPGEDAGAKRKLSDASSTQDDAKRAKTTADVAPAVTTKRPEVPAASETQNEEQPDTKPGDYSIAGPGPFTFFSYESAITDLFGEDAVPAFFYNKQSAFDAVAPVFALPEDDQDDALQEHVETLKSYMVEVEGGTRGTPEAGKLVEMWEAFTKSKKGGGGDGGDDEDEDEEGGKNTKASWEPVGMRWLEVHAQRKKPADEVPAMQVTFSGVGELWLTGFKEAEPEGLRVMNALTDYIDFDY